MKYLFLGLFFGCFAGSLGAQSTTLTTGMISYKSSQNVYVKFESTRNINAGDTLYLKKEDVNIPILIVINLSSTSCVCKPISDIELAISMNVFAINNAIDVIKDTDRVIIPLDLENKEDTLDHKSENKTIVKPEKQKITGSIAATSYSNFSKSSTNTSRFQYLVALNAKNIAESKISAESYISFRHEEDHWDVVQDNIFQALKVYNLSVKYDNNKNTKLTIGRKINNNLSSIGAVDGIQYERKMKSLSLGLIAGSRPDYTDYSFDFNLPQIGAYISHTYTDSVGEMQNSFAIVEQMNTTKTDRRFAYFQHSSTLLKNLFLFGTVEVDLYKKMNNVPENTFSISSTYLSLNYRLFKRLSLAGSYDNRKNVIYYETYKSYINQVIDIEARQGFSFQANYYTMNNLSIGMRTGYRFSNKNSKESKNLYGYVSYNNIPIVKISSTLSANYLEASYVNGKILNLNFSRDFFQGKLFTDLGYQWVNYSFWGSEMVMIQNIVNLSANWRFYKNLSFTVNYEKTFEKSEPYSRMVFQIRKRF